MYLNNGQVRASEPLFRYCQENLQPVRVCIYIYIHPIHAQKTVTDLTQDGPPALTQTCAKLSLSLLTIRYTCRLGSHFLSRHEFI